MYQQGLLPGAVGTGPKKSNPALERIREEFSTQRERQNLFVFPNILFSVASSTFYKLFTKFKVKDLIGSLKNILEF